MVTEQWVTGNWKGDIAKGHKGTFGDDGNVLNLSCYGGYIGVYICHQIVCLTWVLFIFYKL